VGWLGLSVADLVVILSAIVHSGPSINVGVALRPVSNLIVQWEMVLLMQYCDRVDQSMKLGIMVA